MGKEIGLVDGTWRSEELSVVYFKADSWPKLHRSNAFLRL